MAWPVAYRETSRGGSQNPAWAFAPSVLPTLVRPVTSRVPGPLEVPVAAPPALPPGRPPLPAFPRGGPSYRPPAWARPLARAFVLANPELRPVQQLFKVGSLILNWGYVGRTGGVTSHGFELDCGRFAATIVESSGSCALLGSRLFIGTAPDDVANNIPRPGHYLSEFAWYDGVQTSTAPVGYTGILVGESHYPDSTLPVTYAGYTLPVVDPFPPSIPWLLIPYRQPSPLYEASYGDPLGPRRPRLVTRSPPGPGVKERKVRGKVLMAFWALQRRSTRIRSS